jgi:hypothetical protein
MNGCRETEMCKCRKEERELGNLGRYNGKYEKIITEELPKYLGRESRKERVTIARFRCGNEERENKYCVMNQVGNLKFPPSGHLIFFFFTNIRNENKPAKFKNGQERVIVFS